MPIHPAISVHNQLVQATSTSVCARCPTQVIVRTGSLDGHVRSSTQSQGCRGSGSFLGRVLTFTCSEVPTNKLPVPDTPVFACGDSVFPPVTSHRYGAMAFTNACPLGVPTPVTLSQPTAVPSDESVPKVRTNQRVENGLL